MLLRVALFSFILLSIEEAFSVLGKFSVFLQCFPPMHICFCALFFSSFLTPFWMQVWGLITVSGEEVDFIHPGTHQKKKDCTEIEAVSVAPASKIAIAAPENSQETNQILKCQCQNGKNIQHPLLTAFGQGFIHHYCTASCCSLPMLLITGLRAPVDTFLLPETPYTKSTCLFQCGFWPSPNAVWSIKFYLDDLF